MNGNNGKDVAEHQMEQGEWVGADTTNSSFIQNVYVAYMQVNV